MKNKQAQIKKGCLVLFTGREDLLVPIPVIKEIIPNKDFPNMENGFGKIVWRDDILPVFYFPNLFNLDSNKKGVIPTHMVIFKGINEYVDSYGVFTTGIPRSVWLTEADILEQKKGEGPIQWEVKIEGYRCFIPNLDYLEKIILNGKMNA